MKKLCPPPNSLRPATEEDLLAVLSIEKKSHLNPWVESHFAAELTKPYSRFFVLTDDETDSILLGYLVYWIFQGTCHLLNLTVNETYRRQGLGKKLVRLVLQDAIRSQMKKIILEVRYSNDPAIQLYQSVGFSVTQIRKRFYSTGEDAYVMSIPLEKDERTGCLS